MLSKGDIDLKKKIIIILSVVFVAVVAVGYLINRISSINFVNPVMASLPKCDSSECYYSDGFQDYTDYCKYYYEKQDNILDDVKNNQYFKNVRPADIIEINSYFDNFESWLEYVDYSNKYDFQRGRIDTEDYFYIENDFKSDEEHKYWDYDIYFFDVQTKTLYFIHNNI